MIELKTLPDNYELPEYFENRTKGFGDLIRDLHRWHNKEECLLDFYRKIRQISFYNNTPPSF